MSYYYDNYGGGRGGFLASIPPATKNIVAINILLFIATLINQQFMVGTFAMFYPASPLFRPWQILTHMFMHGGFWHIFFNMYTLLMFGIVLERALGTKRFLIFYFVTGLGAAALHTGVEWIQDQVFIANGAHTRCFRSDLWSAHRLCNVLSELQTDIAVPSCHIDSQVVRDNIRHH